MEKIREELRQAREEIEESRRGGKREGEHQDFVSWLWEGARERRLPAPILGLAAAVG